MKNLSHALFLILTLTGATCRKENANRHFAINFHNKSPISVYVESGFNYPDTLNFEFGNPNPATDKVKPGEIGKYALATTRGSYEQILENQVQSKKVMVYVFDAAVIENFSLDTISKKNLVLKRYDLTLEDLRARNWIIEYP